MNYIKQLEADNASQAQALRDIAASFNMLLSHLHSPKFTGTGVCGERKDWISTGDVIQWVLEVRPLCSPETIATPKERNCETES